MRYYKIRPKIWDKEGDNVPISEAQKRANRKYNEKAYDRIEVKVPKGKKAAIKDFASERGKSLNGFVNEAIDEKMERDKA